MTTDLFQNKSEQLANWMKQEKIFSTHAVILKGMQMYYCRSDRTKRDFLKKGLIRKLTEWEKRQRGWNNKDGVYEWVRE